MPSSTLKIAVIVGSLRTGSFSLKLAHALMKCAPTNLQLELIDIEKLVSYDPDLENRPPKEWTRLRKQLATFDALLFVTPEYNRSIPGFLKNAIDIGSTPEGKNVFANKPAAIASISPGKTGGFGANHHLRQILVALNVPTMQHPEAYLNDADSMFYQSGNLTTVSTKLFLTNFMDSFSKWICRFIPKNEACLTQSDEEAKDIEDLN